MSDPFTEWREKGQAPYWLRDDSAADDERLQRMRRRQLEMLQHEPTAKMIPNPLARSWHDL